MRSPGDDPRSSGRAFGTPAVGAGQLAAVPSLGDAEALKLPFDLQRSSLFLVGFAAIAVLAVGAGVAVAPIVGVGVVAAVALALAVALNERIGLVLLAVLVPITSGLGRGVPVPGFRISELLVGGVSAVVLITARRNVRWTLFDWLALFYALATLGLGLHDLLQRHAPISSSELSLMLGPFQFFLLYRAVAVTTPSADTRRLVVRCLLLASIPVAILAIGQQFNAPGFRSLITSLTRNDVYSSGIGARATGPFPHWHNLGGYLFMVLLVNFAILIRRVPGVLSSPVLLGIAALDIVALIETLSIAPIFGVVAGGLILGVWLGGAGRVVLALAVVALVAAFVFGPRLDARYSQQFNKAPGTQRSALVPQTVQYRYDLWTSDILPQLHGRWLTGYGPDLPPALQNFPYTESLYINLLFRGGIVLLAVWLAMAAALGASAARSADREDPLQHALGAALATALLMLFFMQFLEAYFVDSGTPHVLWIVAGLLSFGGLRSAAPARVQRRQAEAAAPA
jgi:hypothetical protein